MSGSVSTEKKLEVMLKPTVEEMGYEIVDVEFVKEGPNWYLRVFVDKDGGVSIDAVSYTHLNGQSVRV